MASKQLRLLHGRVGDSTIVVNSLFFHGFFIINKYGKMMCILVHVYTFCKSLYVINVGSHMVYHMVYHGSLYIYYIYGQRWLVGQIIF